MAGDGGYKGRVVMQGHTAWPEMETGFWRMCAMDPGMETVIAIWEIVNAESLQVWQSGWDRVGRRRRPWSSNPGMRAA